MEELPTETSRQETSCSRMNLEIALWLIFLSLVAKEWNYLEWSMDHSRFEVSLVVLLVPYGRFGEYYIWRMRRNLSTVPRVGDVIYFLNRLHHPRLDCQCANSKLVTDTGSHVTPHTSDVQYAYVPYSLLYHILLIHCHSHN